jgi:hypothetical protein
MADNLPNAKNARVEIKKLTDYLLCIGHPIGHSKAQFFIQYGFSTGAPDFLAASLKKHATTQPVVESKISEFGAKYTLKCTCESPDQRNPCIKTVWIVENDDEIPRLITAYPVR